MQAPGCRLQSEKGHVDDILQLLEQHGLAVIFVMVLGEQLGLPVPASPVLIAGGALAGASRFSSTAAILVASLASLIADFAWYKLGARRGPAILNLLCRISLEPDSCVSSAKTWFARLGARALLFAKYVPGFSTAAPPMAGVTGMPVWRFLLFDAAGSVVWSAGFVLTGVVFRRQLREAIDWVAHFGSIALAVAVALLAFYVALKFYQRRRFILSLRSARITPQELADQIATGQPLWIIDLRHEVELGKPPSGIAGAVWYSRSELDERHVEIPRDRDIILYCS